MSVTAILLSWKRAQYIEEIISAIRMWPRLTEIILWNNNPELTMKSDEFTTINSSQNFYCFTRYAMVPLAKNDTILFHDDDLIINAEQLETIYQAYDQDRERVYGPIGKRLVDGRIYERTSDGLRSRFDVLGECDIVLGRCSLFHRPLYMKAMQYIPLPIKYEDDVAFSLAATKVTGKRQMAVNVGAIYDICGRDEHASFFTKGFAQAREDMAERLR